RPADFEYAAHPLESLLECLHAAGERNPDMSRCTKAGTGDYRHTALIEQQFRELVVVAAAEPGDRARDVGEGVEGTCAREAAHTRQRVESVNDEVMPRLEGLVHLGDALLVAGESCRRCFLRDAAGVRGRLSLDRAHRGDELLRPAAVTDTPAGHCVG